MSASLRTLRQEVCVRGLATRQLASLRPRGAAGRIALALAILLAGMVQAQAQKAPLAMLQALALALVQELPLAQAQKAPQVQDPPQTMVQALVQDPPLAMVQARLLPPGPIALGDTVKLQVDVLTRTWFAQPPQIADLDLPGALVTAPAGHADSISANVADTNYTGLRYTYLISPTAPGALAIPRLDVEVQAGQAPGLLHLRSAALSAQVHATVGGPYGASAVTATQHIEPGTASLKLGERYRRTVTIEARDAQALQIAAPVFPEIDGMRRYTLAPSVQPWRDERGAVQGGRRIDAVEYVAQRVGSFRLPDIQIAWRDMATQAERQIRLPGVAFQVLPNPAYQAPFSMADDLRAMRQGSRHALQDPLLVAIAVLCALAAWLGLPLWRRAWAAAQAAGRRAWARWRDSETLAWWRLRLAAHGPQAPIDPLYRWLRRASGAGTLSGALQEAGPGSPRASQANAESAPGKAEGRQTSGGIAASSGTDAVRPSAHGEAPGAARGIVSPAADEAFWRLSYGREPQAAGACAALREALPRLRRRVYAGRQPKAPAFSLHPLNPLVSQTGGAPRAIHTDPPRKSKRHPGDSP